MKMLRNLKDNLLDFFWRRRVLTVYINNRGSQLKVNCYQRDCDETIRVLQKAITKLKKHKK